MTKKKKILLTIALTLMMLISVAGTYVMTMYDQSRILGLLGFIPVVINVYKGFEYVRTH
ncbi:MAG: hypothetical protein RLZZ165_360 [Bacteroidota bacterium]|jgi:cadmium resistance protein CadD (predicted permease)